MMTPSELARAQADFQAHLARYKALGHDRLQAVRFVADTADAWTGPALDIGTGKGLLAIELAARHVDVVSIDTSPAEQEFAGLLATHRGVAQRIRFVTGDAASLPFGARTFGLVAMMNVLHHLDAHEPVFAEMRRVLAPGGKLLLGEFDREGSDVVARVQREEGREHPEGPVTMQLARAWFTDAGLTQIAYRQGLLHEAVVFQTTGE